MAEASIPPDSAFSEIVLAQAEHLAGAKRLADRFKRELGFLNRMTLQKAIESQCVLVILQPVQDGKLAVTRQEEPEVVGMVHFYLRRDQTVTLYNIVVAQAYQKRGLGRSLFTALVKMVEKSGKTQIRLKCPAELPANQFYQRLGLELVEEEPGKRRPLNIWSYRLKKPDKTNIQLEAGPSNGIHTNKDGEESGVPLGIPNEADSTSPPVDNR
jgi:ribosomal protein S18 acetylase RimI-like enzyme